MTDDLMRLLEVKGAETPAGAKTVRVTLLAWFCVAISILCLASAGLSFIPGGPRTGGFFDWPVYGILSFLGVVTFTGLFLTAAMAAILRMRLTSGRFSGGRHLGAGAGIVTVSVALYVARNCL